MIHDCMQARKEWETETDRQRKKGGTCSYRKKENVLNKETDCKLQYYVTWSLIIVCYENAGTLNNIHYQSPLAWLTLVQTNKIHWLAIQLFSFFANL